MYRYPIQRVAHWLTVFVLAGVLFSGALPSSAAWASPSQAAPASAPAPVANFVNPAAGSANIGMTLPFTWTVAPAATSYYLAIGTAQGMSDVFSTFVPATRNTLAIPALPLGRTLWARIWTSVAGERWLFGTDVRFTLSPGRFLNPLVDSPIRTMVPPFAWSASPVAAAYQLSVGTSPGSSDLYSAFIPASQTTQAVAGLPPGRTLWARLWTESPGFGWNHAEDVSFTVAG
ncbi:MAG: hypothetical protein QOK39_924 [Acidimicrobiaceae bacterium]|nr:hypothetical protein [Acidimicrobiaceae bacterium]